MMILVMIAAVLASVLTRGSGSGGGGDGQQGSPPTSGDIPDDFPGAASSSSGTVDDGY